LRAPQHVAQMLVEVSIAEPCDTHYTARARAAGTGWNFHADGFIVDPKIVMLYNNTQLLEEEP
jgi:hypothetical protein